MQKLLYYCQGFNLALTDNPLFPQRIEAWDHGPVVPDIYHEFKVNGAGAIPIPNDFNPDALSEDEQELVDEIYEVFGQYSAWKLRNLTHEEKPWKKTVVGHEISHKLLKKYFLQYVKDDQEE